MQKWEHSSISVVLVQTFRGWVMYGHVIPATLPQTRTEPYSSSLGKCHGLQKWHCLDGESGEVEISGSYKKSKSNEVGEAHSSASCQRTCKHAFVPAWHVHESSYCNPVLRLVALSCVQCTKCFFCAHPSVSFELPPLMRNEKNNISLMHVFHAHSNNQGNKNVCLSIGAVLVKTLNSFIGLKYQYVDKFQRQSPVSFSAHLFVVFGHFRILFAETLITKGLYLAEPCMRVGSSEKQKKIALFPVKFISISNSFFIHLHDDLS